jgi:hypothetical protein
MFFIMSESAQLAPAREGNWDDFVHHIEQDIIDMLRDDELCMSSTTTRAQFYHACRVLREDRSPAVPYALIGRILGIERSAVKSHFQKGADHLDKVSPNGRPSIFSNEEHEDLIRTIKEAYQMPRPMSIGEISYYTETRFQKSIERLHAYFTDGQAHSAHGIDRGGWICIETGDYHPQKNC